MHHGIDCDSSEGNPTQIVNPEALQKRMASGA